MKNVGTDFVREVVIILQKNTTPLKRKEIGIKMKPKQRIEMLNEALKKVESACEYWYNKYQTEKLKYKK